MTVPPASAAPTASDGADATPQAALERLLAGNRRFAAGTPSHPHQSANHRQLLTGGQSPYAVVLGCSDSRASVELLFDQGFGDVFVVRNAGQVVGRAGSAQASIEFAVAELGVQVVFVLGHESCGAVAATVAHLAGGGDLPGAMPILVDLTREHLDPEDPSHDAVRRHVAGTVQDLLAESTIVAEAVADGRVVVAGGVYGLEDGLVRPVEDARA
ncbi:carbonic anhydrase [Brachybacterium huguangmaarense]|uniref:Carbonic anhydrase n=1 Tax=Brachybacterium huguangmaarense TaxID=1652028 RepID=A0ABY6G231_9MICO|nr:carbonic anhydrase [Brachybacterium huguangmaarense]UYG17019.1 carbonic anhydrase [Brachybacterium huguangmaarense]